MNDAHSVPVESVPRPGPHPKPRDPSAPAITPDALDAQLGSILSEPAPTLAAEATQLGRAHQLLHDALQ